MRAAPEGQGFVKGRDCLEEVEILEPVADGSSTFFRGLGDGLLPPIRSAKSLMYDSDSGDISIMASAICSRSL